MLYGSNKEPGVYRFSPVDYAAGAAASGQAGGVAADTDTPKWAATQGPDEIVVFEGDKV